LLPMRIELPRGLARFNRAMTNPIQRQYAWLVPPWVVVCHRGRRSGRLYRTPVMAFVRGRTLAFVVLYGERSDWVQNVLAGGALLVRAGRTYALLSPSLVDPGDAAGISAAARVLGRLSDRLLVAQLGDPKPGCGRGPR
jgi:deazaflavin-dependent oxidoreductase (nitroreductase family)